MPKNPKAEAQIIALEKATWQAWKDKDVDWFKKNATEDMLWVSGGGIQNKADVLKSIPTGCDVKSFSLSGFKCVMLAENAALLTYTAEQNTICGGKANPPKMRATANYVKRNGKWLEALYMEAVVAQ